MEDRRGNGKKLWSVQKSHRRGKRARDCNLEMMESWGRHSACLRVCPKARVCSGNFGIVCQSDLEQITGVKASPTQRAIGNDVISRA